MAIDLDDLRDSKELLNLILDNMGAAVLIADEALQAELREFLGSAAPDDDISILGLEYTGKDPEPYTI
jgi:hypothetical protein